MLLRRYLTPLDSGGDERSITASIINNYVRMKVIPPPLKKKYSRVHLAYLVIICTLKQSLSISCIQRMLPQDQSEEAVRMGAPVRYGFHTNISTKPAIVATLVKVIREGLYTERDQNCLDEYLSYERRPNGSYGAIAGCHDDLLMTRAIGLHICFHEMDPPRRTQRAVSDFHAYATRRPGPDVLW